MIDVNIPLFFKKYLNYVLPFFIIDVSFEKSCSDKCIERNGKSFGYPCHSLLGIPSELFAKIMLIYHQSFCCYVDESNTVEADCFCRGFVFQS